MKKIITFCFVLLTLSVGATKYHISASGSFSNNGLSPLTPFTTDKCNTLTLSAGDTIALKKGDVIYGSLTIAQSGTNVNPIVITSYGTGDIPTLTGFTSITAWTSLGSNIYESTSAVSSLSTLAMVAINGTNTPMGRYPNQGSTNSGYLNFESHSSNTSITDNQLTDATNWTGAEVVVRPVRWILDRRTITGHTGGTLTFAALSYTPIDGFGYFIQNDARTLDVAGEWYYNTSTKKLKVYNTTTPTGVKVATINDLITINASYVVVDGIKLEGANDNAITGASTLRNGVQVKNCTMTLCGGTVLNGINSENFLISGNTVSYSNNNGISGGTGDHVTITGNTIMNIGLYQGMGTLIYSAISTGENSNVLIKNNVIQNVGNNGISFYGDSTVVQNNYIDTYCSVLDDGGGIYTYTGNRTVMTNDTIKGNIVLNGIGAINGTSGNQTSTAIGIYLDSNSKNVEVSYNTIANTNTYGMLMNNPAYINIHHNTFYNNNPHIRSTFFTGANASTNNQIQNNFIISKVSTQGMITLISTEENLSTWGIIDYNYYARPLATTGNMFVTSQPSATYQNRTFDGWKTYLSQDAHSSLSTVSLASANDIQFEYNETITPKNVYLLWPAIDITNTTKYTGVQTIPTYSSVVYLKDPNPAPTPTPPTGSKVGLKSGKAAFIGNKIAIKQ
jgi:hypothetical protein